MEWLAGGVDHSLPGNGGPDCLAFRSSSRWLWESVLLVALSVSLSSWVLRGWAGLASEDREGREGREDREDKEDSIQGEWPCSLRQTALLTHSMILGLQLACKIASRQLVYLLSPCHMVTALQVYLLAAPSSPSTALLFHSHLGLLNGALLALVFPVLDTYLLPGEVQLFWLQHFAMLAVPLVLGLQGRPYTPSGLPLLLPPVLAYSTFLLYHVLLLQPVALLTGVNIDFVLCPAPSDPFYGPNYLVQATWSQALVILGVSTAYTTGLGRISASEKNK